MFKIEQTIADHYGDQGLSRRIFLGPEKIGVKI